MCGADSPRGFDATHSWHLNIHQHHPYTAVRNEFDRGFTGLAFAGHDEIVNGSQGGGGSQPETGLVVDDPDSHPLVGHLGNRGGPISRTPWCVHHTFHGVIHTLLSRGGSSAPRKACTPFASLSAIFNRGQSINSGFAVDAWRSHHFGSGTDVLTNRPVNNLFAGINVDLAVRDSDAWLYRLGYNITLIGKIVFVAPTL